MDRAATALLDPCDEAARRLAADQLLVANRFCRADVTTWRTYRVAVTWGPDRQSFTVEHGNEQIARWAGFEVLDDQEVWDEDTGLGPIWMGTVRTARGSFAAQFELAPQP